MTSRWMTSWAASPQLSLFRVTAMNARNTSIALLAAAALAGVAQAQRGPAPDPMIREGVTVMLGPHTYAIPDGNVPLVPNVGIVVGSRATLVVDTGLGRRNGEAVLREVAKVSRNTALYIVTTHFHVEHTMGNAAFPASAQYVSSTIQEAEFDEGGMRQVTTFASRSPATADLLKDAVRRPAAITFERTHVLDLGGVRAQLHVVGPTHTKGDTVVFVEGDGVVFAGDVVMNRSFVGANQNSSMKAWLAAFDLIGSMQPGPSYRRTARLARGRSSVRSAPKSRGFRPGPES
jgi:glyoxylase-like metal-dependent hydrolase (beta-lactamase superfamily II)